MANTADTKTFNLVIKTPEKEFYAEPAEELIIETPQGQIGILPGHEPMIAAVAIGPIRIKKNNDWKDAVVSEGYIHINQESVTLLTDTAEWPEEIDANRAKRAEERARERLQGQLSHMEYVRSKAALQRALSRLKVSSQNGR